MILITLGKAFEAKDTIQGWESLVWNERYLDPGNFELKTYNLAGTMNKITLGTPLSLTDSSEVMLVESIILEQTPRGEMATITGRSAEIVLSYRTLADKFGWRVSGSERDERVSVFNYCTVGEAIFMAMELALRSLFTVDSRDLFTEVQPASQYVDLSQAGERLERVTIPRNTNVYDQIFNMAKSTGLGFRTQRRRPYLPQDSGLYVLIRGVNERPDVVIQNHMNHIKKDAKYLRTIKDSYNRVMVNTTDQGWVHSSTAFNVYSPNGLELPSGLNARYGSLDVDKDQSNTPGTDRLVNYSSDNKKYEARDWLKKHESKNVLSVNLTDVGAKYVMESLDAPVGCLVTISHPFVGGSYPMLIEEFIRIHDAKGERYYPTLTDYKGREF